MTIKIAKLSALEILDSRGRPTVQVGCALTGGETAVAQVPSGASTGKAEAVELRDGDSSRHQGLGCRQAVANVEGPLARELVGRPFSSQRELDQLIGELDGTPRKARFGANATLGVSLAFARASAQQRSIPLYEYFSRLCGYDSDALSLPRLTINLFSGGKHAGGQVPIQDVLVVPASANSIHEGLAIVSDVYRAAAEIVQRQYGMRLLTADEGGLAPPFPNVDAMFEDALSAIRLAGFQAGTDVVLAVDVAASHFFDGMSYCLAGRQVDAQTLIGEIERWVKTYQVVSVEDGLAEDAWDQWPQLCHRISPGALTVGDDLLCTKGDRIRRAIDVRACNTLLLKVNQIGTLTEAAESLQLARSAGWRVTVSARSGETEDNWLADLAVGWRGDQIKVGSITQSERLAKYNRLLAIEAETGLPVVGWPA